MKFRKTVKKAFTLIELVVVIAVIAILSAVSVIGYFQIIERANESNANTVLAEIKNLYTLYRVEQKTNSDVRNSADSFIDYCYDNGISENTLNYCISETATISPDSTEKYGRNKANMADISSVIFICNTQHKYFVTFNIDVAKDENGMFTLGEIVKTSDLNDNYEELTTESLTGYVDSYTLEIGDAWEYKITDQTEFVYSDMFVVNLLDVGGSNVRTINTRVGKTLSRDYINKIANAPDEEGSQKSYYISDKTITDYSKFENGFYKTDLYRIEWEDTSFQTDWNFNSPLQASDTNSLTLKMNPSDKQLSNVTISASLRRTTDITADTFYFTSIFVACGFADQSGDKIIVNSGVQELTRNAAVKKGVTLFLPSAEEETTKDYIETKIKDPNYASILVVKSGISNNYTCLKLGDGVTLTVDGTLKVTAMVGMGNKQSNVNGNFSSVNILQTSTLVINGSADIYGVIDGEGQVETNSGSTVHALASIDDWSNSSNALKTYNKGLFPFDKYHITSIKAAATIFSGASVYADFIIFGTLVGFLNTSPLLIGTGGLFELAADGYIKKSYTQGEMNDTDSIDTIDFYGGMKTNYISIEIKNFLQTIHIRTDLLLFPIACFNLNFHEGDYNIDNIGLHFKEKGKLSTDDDNANVKIKSSVLIDDSAEFVVKRGNLILESKQELQIGSSGDKYFSGIGGTIQSVDNMSRIQISDNCLQYAYLAPDISEDKQIPLKIS